MSSAGEMRGQVAVITGGAGGLGTATALRLASQGAHVVLMDVAEAALTRAASTVASAGEVSTAIVDVTDSRSVNESIDSVVRDHGRVDILVASHGFPKDSRLLDMTDEQWDDVVRVCLTGTFHCIRAAAKPMIEQKYGRVVALASRAWHGNPGQANYSAAKAGIVGLIKSVAKELGRHSITANAVAPGLVRTASLEALPTFDKIAERAVRDNSIKRLGESADVVNAIEYLVSPGSGFLTGEVLHVSGGRFG
jgi:3-oxoacyl-[acyl-carrier protein] reductase